MPAAEDRGEPAVKSGLWGALKTALAQWSAHRDAKAGAAIAYYSIFSIGPLIVVVISIVALAFGRESVQKEVTDALRGLLGDKGAEAIDTMLKGAGSSGQGIFAEIIGTVALVYAAVSVVIELKEAMNTVWDAKGVAGSGIWRFLRTYILSLAGVVALGFLLLISMLLTAGLAAFARYAGTFLPEALIHMVGFAVSFAVIAILFALMFKWLPDSEVGWRDVWLGAIGTAVLFEIGKYVIGFYIGKEGLESKFGASASIVVVLIWVYYSAQIVLLGAEFTRARNRQRHAAARPR
jgi:membrane protein